MDGCGGRGKNASALRVGPHAHEAALLAAMVARERFRPDQAPGRGQAAGATRASCAWLQQGSTRGALRTPRRPLSRRNSARTTEFPKEISDFPYLTLLDQAAGRRPTRRRPSRCAQRGLRGRPEGLKPTIDFAPCKPRARNRCEAGCPNPVRAARLPVATPRQRRGPRHGRSATTTEPTPFKNLATQGQRSPGSSSSVRARRGACARTSARSRSGIEEETYILKGGEKFIGQQLRGRYSGR